MRKQLTLILVLILLGEATVAAFASQTGSLQDARKTVEAAAMAMGGAERLRALKSLEFEAMGHWYMLEQSERPEGPHLVAYDEVKELRDLQNNRLRQTTQGRRFDSKKGNPLTMVVADGVAAVDFNNQLRPFTMAQAQDAEEWLALGPERILLHALDAKDLKGERDLMLQSVPHRVVAFTWQGAPVRLFLNAHTSLPTAVELTRAHPYDTFWSVWGDVASRTYFSLWTLEPGGLRYPRQWDNERNGQRYRTLTITDLKFNVEVPASLFTIPDNVRQMFAERGRTKIDDLPLGMPNQQPAEVVKDFVQVRGRWHVALIKQADGVVILEAPISSGYSAKVIAEAEKRFPGVPIKAAVSTSDAFPHLAGVREYAARGIPLYVLDANLPIIKRLLDAPFRSQPDRLARQPRKAELRVVNRKTVIGAGENRLELYPIRTESGERMLMVYAPQHRLLYGSDLVQKMPNGTFFMPQYLSEVADAVAREKLDVERIFAMHSAPLAWSEIQAAIQKASQP